MTRPCSACHHPCYGAMEILNPYYLVSGPLGGGHLEDVTADVPSGWTWAPHPLPCPCSAYPVHCSHGLYHLKDTILREQCVLETICMVHITEPSQGLCVNS